MIIRRAFNTAPTAMLFPASCGSFEGLGMLDEETATLASWKVP